VTEVQATQTLLRVLHNNGTPLTGSVAVNRTVWFGPAAASALSQSGPPAPMIDPVVGRWPAC
jgi:hypothetical protein